MIEEVYLILYKFDPEASRGSLEWIRRQERVLRPSLVDVVEDDHGLADRLSAVDEHRNLLVDRIVVQKQSTFVGKILLYKFVGDPLKLQSPDHSATKRT